MGFPHRKGTWSILNRSCSSVTAYRSPPASLVFVLTTSFEWGPLFCPPDFWVPAFLAVSCAVCNPVLFALTLKNVFYPSGAAAPAPAMHIFGASSLAAAVNTLDVDVFKRRRSLTAIPGLHLVQRSARFPCKTVQFQLQKLFCFHKNISQPHTVL